MKNYCFGFLLGLIHFYSLSQTQQVKDSIPLYLVPNPILPSIAVFPEFPGGIPPYTLPITWPEVSLPYPFDWRAISVTFVQPKCGNSYHENGKLWCHVECLDGKQHGTTTYYDENGRKTSEQYFLKGKNIGSKSWDEKNRLVSWVNYNGKGELHGKQFEFIPDENRKVYTSYLNGTEHGTKKEYIKGKLMIQQKFVQGDIVENTTFYENGKISEYKVRKDGYLTLFQSFYENGQIGSYSENDNLGRAKLQRTWNSDGILTAEFLYENGQSVGTSLNSYDPVSGIRSTTDYRDGHAYLTQERKGNTLLNETKYSFGRITERLKYFDNGDTNEHFKADSLNRMKIWNSERKLSFDFMYDYNNHLIGKGFFTFQDTLFIFSAPYKSEGSIASAIKRWVVYNKDTIRFEYVRNDASMTTSPSYFVLCSNKYVKDPISGIALEQGIWSYYNDNRLSHVLTFNKGDRDGKAVFYNSSDPPSVNSEGYFKSDKRIGEWIQYTSTGIRYTTYVNGIEHGTDKMFYPNGQLHYTCTKTNGKTEGEYFSYHENGQLNLKCFYVNDKREGYQYMYDDKGRILNEGLVVGNTTAGIWYYYSYDVYGKVTKKKMKYYSSRQIRKINSKSENSIS